jgi:hypothetical protein
MKFFILQGEPIAEVQFAKTDFFSAQGSKRGHAPRCEACGQWTGMRQWLPPYRVELEAWGNQFADVMSNGTDLIVSEAFKKAWEESALIGLSGFDEVEVVKIKRHRKMGDPQPAYFRANVARSQTAIDLLGSEFEWESGPICPVCLTGHNVQGWKRVIVDQRTWAGDDVFIARGLPSDFVVTEGFKEFCDYNNPRNVVLVPSETYGRDFYGLK